MTKAIRVENADTGDWKVRVHIEDRQLDGTWVRTKTQSIDHPAALLELHITATRRLVVEEATE